MRAHKYSAVVADRWSPELEALWAPFLQSDRPLLICLGTPLFVRFVEFGFFRDPKANDLAEIEKSDRVAAGRKAFRDKSPTLVYPFIGVGEASAAVVVSQLLSSRKRSVLLTRSNILSWQQIVENDVVFVGPPEIQSPITGCGFESGYCDRTERDSEPQTASRRTRFSGRQDCRGSAVRRRDSCVDQPDAGTDRYRRVDGDRRECFAGFLRGGGVVDATLARHGVVPTIAHGLGRNRKVLPGGLEGGVQAGHPVKTSYVFTTCSLEEQRAGRGSLRPAATD